jgi:LmeA-like phospholipid-binding
LQPFGHGWSANKTFQANYVNLQVNYVRILPEIWNHLDSFFVCLVFLHAPVNLSSASQPLPLKSSHPVAALISTAVQLLLRSQLTDVETLQVQIQGRMRQLLTGRIPKVSVSARHGIYQGLYLHQVSLVAQDIRIDLGQILQGQPLRLLEPVPVKADLWLNRADLNASLASPLLSNALTEIFFNLLGKASQPDILLKQSITWQQIAFERNQLTVQGICHQPTGEEIFIGIQTHLQVKNCHILQLDRIQINVPENIALESLEIDLGSDVTIDELTLDLGQLICRGRGLVNP